MQLGEVACKETDYGNPINGFSLQATEETFKQGIAMRWTAQNILLSLLYLSIGATLTHSLVAEGRPD